MPYDLAQPGFLSIARMKQMGIEVPDILLTGGSFDEVSGQAKDFSNVKALSKPVSFKAPKSLLSKHLDHK